MESDDECRAEDCSLQARHCQGGGFKDFLCSMFTPKIGEDSQFDSYFSNGLNRNHPTRCAKCRVFFQPLPICPGLAKTWSCKARFGGGLKIGFHPKNMELPILMNLLENHVEHAHNMQGPQYCFHYQN